MHILRIILLHYLWVGILMAGAFHWIMTSGEPFPIDGDYLDQVVTIGLMWPVYLLFVVIIILAAAG